MSGPSIGIRSFVSQSVSIERWKKYGLIMGLAFLVWAALYGMVDLAATKLARAGAFALVVTAAACWRDWRRTNL